MAIARGAGTEIVRSIFLEDLTSTGRILIYGEAHHIYTVLSIICFASTIQADGNFVSCYLTGYDSLGGTTGQSINVFQNDMSLKQTFVWNDKFSFNGNEPTNFTGPMDDATKQNAIADQAQATTQSLKIATENASDGFDITCTFIDQNNA